MITNLYAVTAMCGHVGKNKYIAITFPITAKNARDAAKVARWIPRVKHHVKNAILEVKKITSNEYNQLIAQNRNDKYLSVHSKQEQKSLCENIESRIVYNFNEIKIKNNRNDIVKYKLKKQKIIEKSYKKYEIHT